MTVSDLAPDRLDESPAGGRIPPVARKRLKGAFIGFGLFLWVMSGAMGGVKGATLAAVISVLVAAVLAARPGIAQWLLVDSPTADVPPHRHGPFLTDLAERTTRTRTREVLTGAVLLSMTVVVAIGAATIGEKALIILVGLMALIAMVAFIKNRTLFFMFVFASSFTLILYKKFTPVLSEHYAVAIYITTVDVVLLLLYLIWAYEGSLFRDLRSGLKNPVLMLPLVGVGLTLLSAVNASDQRLVWAETVRYLWMTALFVYVGIRVRRREHIWAFMLGWMVFLGVQVLVTTSQKRTGGFLGIDLLRLKPDPLDPMGTEYLRPFGTQIHPVFLGCVVGMLCLMVSCFALHVPKRNLMRYVLLSCIPLAFVLVLNSKTRAALVALVPAVAVVLFLAYRRKLISPRILIVGLLLGLIGMGVFSQQITGLTGSLFGSGTSNAGENWRIRWQINLIGYRMVRDNPLVGTGLNSFTDQMDKYAYEQKVFDKAPAHNLFVLMAAETGLIGLGMTIVIGLAYARYAYRLTRMRDPMYVSLGIGALAVLVFLTVEELNNFTLKQDVPMAMFWTIFGLVVAANRMADENAPALPALSWLRPSLEDDTQSTSVSLAATAEPEHAIKEGVS